MSKILSIDDMLEALTLLNHPQASDQIRLVEAIANGMSRLLADKLKCGRGLATFQPGFGGTCAAFFPLKKSKAWPESIDHLDSGGDYAPGYFGALPPGDIDPAIDRE